MNQDVIHLEEADGCTTRNIDFNQQDALRSYIAQNPTSRRNEPPAVDTKLKLRKYQVELCAEALKGQNTVICAPTGSGKTIVAVNLIQEHLRGRLESPLKGKVILLVPTVNLIDQQTAVLNEYLSDQFKIIAIKGGQQTVFSLLVYLTWKGVLTISFDLATRNSCNALGSNKVPKSVQFHENDISVMTPQLFVNLLSMTLDEENLKTTTNGISNKILTVAITDVTLMVFDECHHTDKSHAYNEIMNFYFDLKYSQQTNSPLPQVVGLTASLGVGQADNARNAIDHIIKICANLDVTKLSIIQRYTDELEEFVYAPKDEIVTVQSPHERHALSVNIIKIMTLLEKEMEPVFKHLEESKVKTTNEVDKKAPERRWSSQYTSWLYGWYHYAPRLVDSDLKQKLITLLKHCIIYHKSLEINALSPTMFAVEYLREEYSILRRKQTTVLDKELINLYEKQKDKFHLIGNSTEDKKPIVDKLKYLLLKEYDLQPDSRTLIFVRTRELALAVEKFINNDSSLFFLNAGHLTGVNARKDTGGQTEREQQDCLERFRKGDHKLLVATTVAEEGLDISKCNLVIKYNHVTNEIALVQRRGRGRAVGSKSILLTHEGWIQQKETVNLIRERLMKTAIEIIMTRTEKWFVDEVNKRVQQMRREKDIEKKIREMDRKKLGNKKYDLLCRKCDTFLTSSSNVRSIQGSHYVGVDENIWPRFCAEPKPQPLLYSDLSVAGVLSCANCREDCGVIIKYRQVFLPALKADGLVLREPNAVQKHTAKKWKQVQANYFVVDPIKTIDLPPMYHALSFTIREKLDKALDWAQQQTARDEDTKNNMNEAIDENSQKALYFIEGDLNDEDLITVAYDLINV